MIWQIAFWKGAAERAIKSAAQGFIYGTGLSFVATGLGDGTGVALIDIPWLLGAQSAVVMAILSLATSIGNADFTAGESPQVPVTHVEHTYATDMSAEDVERLIVSLRSDKYPAAGQEH